MNTLRFLWVTIVQTCLRALPFPCKTGLIVLGKPARDAPVLLTGNFRLTVERVRRACKGLDAYLLVANSHGINVWCAATGGLLTNHDVISVLKTSGIEELVDHRSVILPQLAATGIEGNIVHRKTGWKVIWGPVYATSIPAFLNRGLKKTQAMETVRFPWSERVEMATAWAFPVSLIALLGGLIWKEWLVLMPLMVWAFSFIIFLSFPLYEKALHTKSKHIGFILFDFGERGIPLVLWGLFMVGLVAYVLKTGEFSWLLLLRWSLASLVIVLILCLDLTGSTPTYKSGLHEDRLLRIALDPARCKGAAFCEQVCPTRVFEIDRERRLAILARIEQCVQCGACIVQCPFDALYFQSPKGEVITPDTIRAFKLNLLGKRYKDSSRRE